MLQNEKPLVWLSGEVKTPPFSSEARKEAGFLLRQMQNGIKLSLPHPRPMPIIGRGCHELRIDDKKKTWRIVCKVNSDSILIVGVFVKMTRQTPRSVIQNCQRRIRAFDKIYLSRGEHE